MFQPNGIFSEPRTGHSRRHDAARHQRDGTIFGGVILALMDQAAYIEAMHQAHHRYVTVFFKEVTFKMPVYVGDVLSLYAETLRMSCSLISINVRVCANRRTAPDRTVEVTQRELVFVSASERFQEWETSWWLHRNIVDPEGRIDANA